MSPLYDPNQWLTSMFANVADFIRTELDAAIKNNVGANAGLQVFDVVMDYPTPETLPKPAEFSKTIIHLEIDDIDNKRLGFGSNVFNATIVEPTVGAAGTITEDEGASHEINFDVGIWASDKSGGISSRLLAYQTLYKTLGTEMGRRKFKTASGGVEIRRFNNGRSIIDKINDIRVYRMVGAELVVRVFSSTAGVPDVFADTDKEPAVNTTVKTSDGLTIVDS